MNKEEIELTINQLNDSLENTTAKEIKDAMIQIKDKTTNKIKDKLNFILEVEEFVKNKNVEEIKIAIIILVNKIEFLLKKRDEENV